MSDDGQRQCAVCAKQNVNKRCGKCQSVYYCDIDCQRKHWPEHRGECGGDAESAVCAICLDEIQDGETLPCKHVFCAECVGQWRCAGSGDDASCPLCRGENAVHRVYVPTDEVSDAGANGELLSAKIVQSFGDQIAPPLCLCQELAVRFDVFMVPESLLQKFRSICNEDLIDGYPTSLKRSSTANAERTWHVRCYAVREPLDDTVVRRVTSDPRFARLVACNGKLRRHGQLALHKSIEREMRLGVESMYVERDREPGLLDDDEFAQALASVGDDKQGPLSIVMQFGPRIERLTGYIPQNEVKQLRSAHRMYDASERLSDEQARFMILYNRLRNRICNCCWRCADEQVELRRCKHCEMTWYCSMECLAADWPWHARWCRQDDAPLDQGPLRTVLMNIDDRERIERLREEQIGVLQM